MCAWLVVDTGGNGTHTMLMTCHLSDADTTFADA